VVGVYQQIYTPQLYSSLSQKQSQTLKKTMDHRSNLWYIPYQKGGRMEIINTGSIPKALQGKKKKRKKK
jgi:hypothetical protein